MITRAWADAQHESGVTSRGHAFTMQNGEGESAVAEASEAQWRVPKRHLCDRHHNLISFQVK